MDQDLAQSLALKAQATEAERRELTLAQDFCTRTLAHFPPEQRYCDGAQILRLRLAALCLQLHDPVRAADWCRQGLEQPATNPCLSKQHADLHRSLHAALMQEAEALRQDPFYPPSGGIVLWSVRWNRRQTVMLETAESLQQSGQLAEAATLIRHSLKHQRPSDQKGALLLFLEEILLQDAAELQRRLENSWEEPRK